MFGIKELKAKVAGYDQSIDMVAKAINGYFQTNEKPNKDFEIEVIGDKLVNFIVSADLRLAELEKENERMGCVLKEKDDFIEKLKELSAEQSSFIEKQTAIIKAQTKEIEILAKAKMTIQKKGDK